MNSSECAVEITVLAQDAAAVDVSDGGLKAHVLEVGFVTEILGFLEGGLPIVLVGGVLVLVSFGVLTFFIPRLG